jgi:WD40 repeat protein
MSPLVPCPCGELCPAPDPAGGSVCPRCRAPLAPAAVETVALPDTPPAVATDGETNSFAATGAGAATVEHPPTAALADPDATRTLRRGGPAPRAADPGLPSLPGLNLVGILGRGGMGVVYRAEQVALKRTVAVKMILANRGAVSEVERDRFRTEAEAVARLQHPNIVQIFEVGECDGNPYCVLEYADGGTLAGRIGGAALPPDEACRTVEALARAMHLAHSRNIVHRDLKPANVLLAGDGTPKVTDFGLAKRLDTDSGHTVAGSILGTPAYMAPEQAEGDTLAVGPAADVYALGAILFECLTGRPPFRGKTTFETLHLVRTEEAGFPPDARGVPRDVATVCLKCLRKEPEHRYGSAEALADDLRRWRAGEPVLARPAGRGERAAKWARRNPAVAALLFVAAAAVAGGTAATYAKYLDARTQKEQVARKASDLEAANGLLDAALRTQERLVADLQREKAEVALQRAAVQWQLDRAEFVAYGYQLHQAATEIDRGDVDRAIAVLGTCKAERCGWEYDYLLRGCERPHLAVRADRPLHRQVVRAVAASADGRLVATASDDGTVKLFDVAAAREAHTLKGHAGGVTCVAVSPDGKWIASGNTHVTPDGGILGTPGDVRVWDAGTGAEVFRFTGHKGPIGAVAFSPDGARVASGDRNGIVTLWEARTGAVVGTRKVLAHSITRLRFGPEGRAVAVAGARTKLALWYPAAKDAPPVELEGHTLDVRGVRFGADELTLVSCAADNTQGELRVWNLRNPQANVALTDRGGRYVGAALANGGSHILTVSEFGRVQLRTAANGSLVTEIGHLGDTGTSACDFTADCDRVVTAEFTGRVCVADVRPGFNPRTVRASRVFVTGAAAHPDGTKVATADRACAVTVWDARTGTAGLTLTEPPGFSRYVSFSRDGTRLVTGGLETTKDGEKPGPVRVYDAATGTLLKTLPGGFTAPEVSPDGALIASGDKVLDAASGAVVRELQYKDARVAALAFRPDGTRVACAAGSTVVELDPRTGEVRAALPGHTANVLAAAYSPDGTRLATVGLDRTVRVWDAGTGAAVHALRGHTCQWLHAVAFSPDGRRILSAGGDRNIGEAKLWDAASGQEAFTLDRVPWWTTGAGFVAGGRTVFAAGQDGTLRLYATSAQSWVRSLGGHETAILSLAVSPDGTRTATGGEDGAIRLWGATGTAPVAAMKSAGRVNALAFSGDGTWLASGATDRAVTIWDAATGAEVRTIDPKFVPGRVNAVAFTPDGEWLLIGTDAGASGDAAPLAACSTRTGLPRAGFAPDVRTPQDLCVSRDGRRVLVGCTPPTVVSTQTGATELVASGSVAGYVLTARLNPADGTRAAFVTQNGALVYGGLTGPVRGPVSGPGRPVTIGQTGYRAADVSPDGKWIVTGGADRTVQLRPVANPTAFHVLGSHLGGVTRVAFAPDGKSVVSASLDRTAKVWAVPDDLERALAAPARTGDP